MFLNVLIWLWLEGPAFAVSSTSLLPPRTGLRLLQQLGGSSYLNPSAPGTIQIIYDYFGYAQQWIFGVAAGICILNVLWGGILILNSGGDPTKRSEGVTKATWSIAGLLLLAVVSAFMIFLNPAFYTPASSN